MQLFYDIICQLVWCHLLHHKFKDKKKTADSYFLIYFQKEAWQFTRNVKAYFLQKKIYIYILKCCLLLLISSMVDHICCGYSIKVLWYTAINEYKQHLFSRRYKKNINTFWLKNATHLELCLCLKLPKNFNWEQRKYFLKSSINFSLQYIQGTIKKFSAPVLWEWPRAEIVPSFVNIISFCLDALSPMLF